HHIVGFAGGRIGGEAGDHAADLAAGQDLVAGLDGEGVGNELIVQALENGVVVVLFLILHQADAVVGVELTRVDLVEGEPVVHSIPQPLKEGAGVTDIALHRLAAFPTAIFEYQVHRDVVVEDGGKDLDAAAVAFVEQVDVKAQ